MEKRLGARGRHALAITTLCVVTTLAVACADQEPRDRGTSGLVAARATDTTPAEPYAHERKLFRTHCGACHILADAGATGTGAGGYADLDQIKPNSSSVQYYLEHRVGKMPAFKRKLSRAERKALALYVAEVDGCGIASPTECDP